MLEETSSFSCSFFASSYNLLQERFHRPGLVLAVAELPVWYINLPGYLSQHKLASFALPGLHQVASRLVHMDSQTLE